ncbi:hypothetical protein BB560_002870 [Smittium megazygosporum]|uniref:Major facilitator superfamily (MFS) profile domain-containing protein n=1 Tax=Smittium megazygosporum TaxID=133381 RepID=A0A2T9ZDP8_9FUNG|nr:hypothetical protein BB560_002870 [Smittium megazygosporum]
MATDSKITINSSAVSTESPVSIESNEKVKQDSTPPVPELSERQKYMATASLCLAIFIAGLDNTILATSLPTISNHFNDFTKSSWIITANLVTTTCFQPLYGKISDIFGHREAFILAIAIFIISSIISGLAQSITMLICSRALSGIGGAGITVMVQIIISQIISLRERGKYSGFIGVSWGLSSVVGPLLGGYFTDKVSWRWCFFINVPIGVITGTAVLILIKLPHPQGTWKSKVKRIDFVGITLLLIGLILILLALNFGGVKFAWNSAPTICLLVFGVVIIAAFAYHQYRYPPEPIIPVRMLSIRNFWAVISAQFCLGFTFYCLIFFLPLFDSVIYDGSASQSGLFLLPFVVSLVVLSVITGILMTITGKYRMFFRMGSFLVALGTGLMISIHVGTKKFHFIIFMILAGFGNGMTNQSLLVCVQASVPKKAIGIATSTAVFIRTFSGAIGVAIISAVQRTVFSNKVQLIANEYPQSKQSILSVVDDSSVIQNQSLISSAIRSKILLGYSVSFRVVFIILAAMASLCFVFTLFTQHNHLSRPSKPTTTTLTKTSEEV